MPISVFKPGPIPNDPRRTFLPEDHLPSPELLHEEPEVIVNDRLVCPECGGSGCEECE